VTELEAYLSTAYVSDAPWDPTWWRTHHHRFPHVAQLARSLQAVPAAAAPTGRFSSIASLLRSPITTRAAADKAERVALLALNDGLWDWKVKSS